MKHGRKTTKVVVHVKGGSKAWVVKPGKGATTFKVTYTRRAAADTATVQRPGQALTLSST